MNIPPDIDDERLEPWFHSCQTGLAVECGSGTAYTGAADEGPFRETSGMGKCVIAVEQ